MDSKKRGKMSVWVQCTVFFYICGYICNLVSSSQKELIGKKKKGWMRYPIIPMPRVGWAGAGRVADGR